jgi:hypothetical protein
VILDFDLFFYVLRHGHHPRFGLLDGLAQLGKQFLYLLYLNEHVVILLILPLVHLADFPELPPEILLLLLCLKGFLLGVLDCQLHLLDL